MAFGDVGGAVTELVITCKTPSDGDINIEAGDPVAISDPYTVSRPGEGDHIFGQALATVNTHDTALPVKVRGICIFRYTGSEPTVDGATGVVPSSESGFVTASSDGRGIIVKFDSAADTVHVLL